MEHSNPLLNLKNEHRLKAIPFPEFKTEHYLPAIEAGLVEAKAEIEALKNNPDAPTFENTILELDMNGELLDYVATVYFNLLGAESDAEFKALAQQISPKLAEFGSMVATDPLIFARVKAVYDAEVAGKAKPTIPTDLNDKEAIKKAERYRLIDRTYTGFIRGGAMLNDADKKRLTEISMESSQLSPKFSDNVLNATNKWELHITDAKDVEGIPENSLNTAAFMAKKKGKEDGWLFTLQPSSIMPVLTYCKNREIRKQVQAAYASRAFKDEFDNQELVKQTLKLRKERAALLGYKTHADFV
jgi:Zn-dependent oligopeptidase